MTAGGDVAARTGRGIPRYEEGRHAADPSSGVQQADARTDALADDYDRDGYLILRGHFDAARIDAAVEYVMAAVDADAEAAAANRVQDAWRDSPAIRELACDDAIMDLLRTLYGRKPVPFQTLNFLRGSQQSPHADAMHFSTLPPRFVCGVWVALEDVTAANGPLVFYPGSHRLPEFQLDDFGAGESLARPTLDDYAGYPEFLERQLQRGGYEPSYALLKKGDVFIWSANLAHGGAPIEDPESTRLSQVTHYFFDRCVYYTPRLSQPYIGRYWLRRIQDIQSGEPVDHGYRDVRFSVPAPGLYVFAANGQPRPVDKGVGYWKTRLRNVVKPLLKPGSGR